MLKMTAVDMTWSLSAGRNNETVIKKCYLSDDVGVPECLASAAWQHVLQVRCMKIFNIDKFKR